MTCMLCRYGTKSGSLYISQILWNSDTIKMYPMYQRKEEQIGNCVNGTAIESLNCLILNLLSFLEVQFGIGQKGIITCSNCMISNDNFIRYLACKPFTQGGVRFLSQSERTIRNDYMYLWYLTCLIWNHFYFLHNPHIKVEMQMISLSVYKSWSVDW